VREGASVVTQIGTTYAGDGTGIDVQANWGLPLGAAGFFNISGQLVRNHEAERASQVPAAAALAAAGIEVANPAQHWGAPPLEAQRLVFNAGLPLARGAKLYFFGNFGHGDMEQGFYYRDPTDEEEWLASEFTLQDGSPFSWSEVFPGGFAPLFTGQVRDESLALGIKQTLASELSFDFSGSYGANRLSYELANTVNPSLGPASPREFDVGSLRQKETELNADFTYPLPIRGLSSPFVFIAFGAEWRRETYTIEAGDALSYEAGPYAADGMPIGSNGYPGFSPDSAGEFKRDSFAVYGDAEANLTQALSVGVAARFEDFDGFGSTTNWKVQGRYELNDEVALRASVNTGFRVPTPGQSQTTSLQTSLDDDGNLVALAAYPPDSVVAEFFGARALVPETSFNFSAGVVFTLPRNISLTFDYYRIEVKDRIGQTSAIAVSDADRATLEALGVPGANTLGEVTFPANAFETRTQGIDIVATKRFELQGGQLHLTAAANLNRTEVLRFDPDVIDDETRGSLENDLPERRVNVAANYRRGKLDLLLRANHYGPWHSFSDGERYGAAWLLDVESGYQLTAALNIVAGVANLFDRYPDESVEGLSFGMRYPDNSPFGYDGGHYYLRLNYRFH
jgi:iron complex outermembrane recepter protein